MQSFPQPPSAKEEREYLKRCRAGDKDARNALIERNLRLVAYIAKKYASMDRDMEDLISIGTIGLIKAVDSFDESKGIRLASYASRCVENELLMNFRARKKSARDVYLYDTIGSDKEGNEISLIDIIEYEDEDIPERLTREQGRRCVRADTHRKNKAMLELLRRHGYRYRGNVLVDEPGHDPRRVAYEKLLK